MKKFKEYFIAHYFMRFGNGKFLIVEGAYIFMIIACAILAWGVLEYFDTWYIIPFIIPFAIGAYLVIWGRKVKDIRELNSHWRTQLRLLSDPKMAHEFNSLYDKRLEDKLEEKWEATYGQRWDETEMVKLHPFQPLVVVIIVLTIVWIWRQ